MPPRKMPPARALHHWVKQELGLDTLPEGLGDIDALQTYLQRLRPWLEKREGCGKSGQKCSEHLGIPFLDANQLRVSDWWAAQVQPLIDEDYAAKEAAAAKRAARVFCA